MLGFKQIPKNSLAKLAVRSQSASCANSKATKAKKHLEKYLSPWPREVAAQSKGSAAPSRAEVPVFVLGKAGQIAMKFWRRIATTEGADGLARTELELSVFFRVFQRSLQLKELVKTADAFISVDEKERILKQKLNSLGCSEVFTGFVSQVLRSGDFARLEQIYVDFAEINRSFRREVDVALITGRKLDLSTLEFYKSTISLDFLDPADNMIFTHSVDPTLDGYKVLVKNKVYDFTSNEEKAAAQRRIAEATHFSARDELFKELEGVVSHTEIEKLWNAQLGQREFATKIE
jgi:F0F1-type ATP synthase delta subunit